MLRLNPIICTDSYKISHPFMYPEDTEAMFDYIAPRKGGQFEDVVVFGVEFYKRTFLDRPFTWEDIDEAEVFFNKHFATSEDGTVFNREMFEYILEEYGGYFPVKIKCAPEGTVVKAGNVIATVECDDPKCATIVSFLETSLLRCIWYGSTVATISYHFKKVLREYGVHTGVVNINEWLAYAMHDFASRGVSSSESCVLGGMAHLTQFFGSDNLEAIYAAEKIYGDEEIRGYSVVASEHSVMGSKGKDGEFEVIERIFKRYGKPGAIIACVNDTYDMDKHLDYICDVLGDRLEKSSCRWVTRPDSGEPKVSVARCLNRLWARFGGTINEKGFKVLNPCVRVIQGDGIDITTIEEILQTIVKEGFSVENVIFGCGGGLLQKCNRDTLRFAMKASWLKVSGKEVSVFKCPVTQPDKASLAGRLSLYDIDTVDTFKTLSDADLMMIGDMFSFEEVLKTTYSNGTFFAPDTMETIAARSLNV